MDIDGKILQLIKILFCGYRRSAKLPVGRWGGEGGLAPVTFLPEKSWKKFDSLMKIFNILKLSMQSIQNPAFS